MTNRERAMRILHYQPVDRLPAVHFGYWQERLKFAPARKKFGPEMRGVGCMDKTALRCDRAAVDAELERIRALIALGGFLLCPDHRLMPGTKFELVQYYVDEIKKITA